MVIFPTPIVEKTPYLVVDYRPLIKYGCTCMLTSFRAHFSDSSSAALAADEAAPTLIVDAGAGGYVDSDFLCYSNAWPSHSKWFYVYAYARSHLHPSAYAFSSPIWR